MGNLWKRRHSSEALTSLLSQDALGQQSRSIAEPQPYLLALRISALMKSTLEAYQKYYLGKPTASFRARRHQVFVVSTIQAIDELMSNSTPPKRDHTFLSSSELPLHYATQQGPQVLAELEGIFHTIQKKAHKIWFKKNSMFYYLFDSNPAASLELSPALRGKIDSLHPKNLWRHIYIQEHKEDIPRARQGWVEILTIFLKNPRQGIQCNLPTLQVR